MKHERFGFYCERKDDPSGRVDTLRLDFTDRTFEYIALIDRSQLGKGYYGTTLMEVHVTAEQLAELHRIVRACFEGGSMTTGGWLCGDGLPVRSVAEPERETVAKERVLAAVRRTLTGEAIASIAAHGKPERADYFDLPAMLSAVEDFLEGKMSASAFADWCLLMMRCFQDGGSFRGVPGLWELYDELADSFDGMAFTSEDCTDEETRLCVLEFYWSFTPSSSTLPIAAAVCCERRKSPSKRTASSSMPPSPLRRAPTGRTSAASISSASPTIRGSASTIIRQTIPHLTGSFVIR